MIAGLTLTSLSLAAAAGNIATYYPKMMSNHATLRPRREQAFMVLALALAVAGFLMHPGLVGYIAGGLAIVPASLFLLGTSTSGLPQKRPAVAVGDMAPDFVATNAEGKQFRLSDLRGSAVLLKVFRGYWCPYCVAELAQLDKHAGQFAAMGVSLVGLSSDRVDELQPFARKQKWSIELLADPTLAVHRLYNVQHRKFAARRGPFREIAIPTTVLIDKDGKVLLIEQTADFRVRPQADMLLAKTRALLQQSPADADACDVCVA